MLSRPLITTITPHQFLHQSLSEYVSGSSHSSITPSASYPRTSSHSFSHRYPFVWLQCLIVISIFVGVPSLITAQNCVLTIPSQPLTLNGLATPWILSGTGCSQANPKTATFVQGAVIDSDLGTISIYDPLVVDQNKQPLAQPVPPTALNTIAKPVVAYWVQTHAKTITLMDNVGGAALRAANCSSGIGTVADRFGKFAFCNAWAFFQVANIQVGGGQLVPRPLGKGTFDDKPCPSFRDYAFLGRDHHGTVMTTYLLNPRTNQTAHDTPANLAVCNGACIIIQSDSARLLNNIYNTIGCALWVRPDMTDANTGINQQQASALPLNEIQARYVSANLPQSQVALIPANDTLAVVNGIPNLRKLNLLRDALNQPQVPNLEAASTVEYCKSMTTIPPPRLALDAPLLKAFQRQGDTDEAVDLYTLVVKRQIQLYTDLGCETVSPVPFQVIPPDWTTNAATPLEDAIPIQPPPPMGQLRCENMFIIDTKCSFLVALLVVGGGLVLGFIMFLLLKIVQAWKYGDKLSQENSTRAAIRV